MVRNYAVVPVFFPHNVNAPLLLSHVTLPLRRARRHAAGASRRSHPKATTARASAAVLAAIFLPLTAAASPASPTSLAPAVPISDSRTGGPSLAFEPASATGLAAYGSPSDPGRPNVFVRRIDARGRPMAAALQVSATPAGSDPGGPAIAFNTVTREYLVVWTEGPRQARELVLRGRRIAADGRPAGEILTLGEEPVSAFSRPTLAASGVDGGYLLAFSAPGSDIRARVLDASGAVRAEEVVSPALSNGCGFPTVAHRARADEYLVGFSCGLPAEDSQPPQTQYIRRMAVSGAALGPVLPIITPRFTRFGNGELALAYNSRADEFLFVGQNRRRIGTRRLDGAGQPIARVRTLRRASFEVETSGLEVAFDPRLARYLVAWSGTRRRGRHDGNTLFTTRLDARGIERGPEAIRPGADPSSIAARGASGGFLLGLSDPRSGRALVRFVGR